VSRAERITGGTGLPGGEAEHLRGLAGSGLAGRVRPVALAGDRALPLGPGLEDLFPSGILRRGSTVVVATGQAGERQAGERQAGERQAGERQAGERGAGGRLQGTTSLALSLAAAASAAGSWCAVVGLADLGLVAAAEIGLALDRLALVPRAEPRQWLTVVGALLDTVDLVIARPPTHLRAGDARRLTARARERGSVLIPVLNPSNAGGAWADGADVRLIVASARWVGPGSGDGHLRGRRVEVVSGGRGAAARERRAALWLPGPDGGTGVAAERRPGAVNRDRPILDDRVAGVPGVDTPAVADDGAGAGGYAGADVDLLPDPADPTVDLLPDPADPTVDLRSAG